MGDQLEQFTRLKQSLLDFTLDAEGDLATALEAFNADQSKQWTKTGLQGIDRLDLATDMFLTEGRVAHQSVLDMFLQHQPDVSASERALVENWHRSFNGLFAVEQVTDDGYECLNWLTDKRYWVRPNDRQAEDRLTRLKPGEMMITRIFPVTDDYWTFSGPMMLLGKLGKPKLAVAIGNFKKWFPQHLYGDAPDLLEEAWKSVEVYHQEFIEFFGGDRLTLSGYELGKKLKAYQDFTTQKRMEEAGLDPSKSFQEMAEQAGLSEDEIAESVDALGEDSGAVRQLLKKKEAVKMAMPPIELPPELRQAKAITVFVHPRWGQTFLTDYSQFVELLESTDEESLESLDRLTLKYLKNEAVNPHVWRFLAEEYPEPLAASLKRVLDNPDFDLEQDLDETLLRFDRPQEPTLPEIASVPLHLHVLFQEALQEVSKKKSKQKSKKTAGFGV